MNNKAAFNLLKYGVTLLLLGYVLFSAGLFSREGWLELKQTITNANNVYLLAAFLFTIVMVYVSAVKWYFLSRALGLEGSIYQLFSFYMVGRYFNLVLPSGIGGDISRVMLQGKAVGNRAASAAIVFVDRVTGLIALIFLVLVVLFFYSDLIHVKWLGFALFASIVALLLICWIAMNRRSLAKLASVSNKYYPKSAPLFSKIGKFQEHVLMFRNSYSVLGTAMFWSLAFYICAIINVWLCVVAFDLNVSILPIALAVPVIMIIMNMPISVGNIGLLEFSHMIVLGLFGIETSVILSAILLIRLKTFFAACIGWVYFSVLDIELPTKNVQGD